MLPKMMIIYYIYTFYFFNKYITFLEHYFHIKIIYTNMQS